MRVRPWLFLVFFAGLTGLLAGPSALAQTRSQLAPSQSAALSNTLARFSGAMEGLDWRVISETIPPKVLDGLAAQSGLSEDELVEAMEVAMAITFETVTLEDFHFDRANESVWRLNDGTTFIRLPTVTDLSIKGAGKMRATSETIAFLEGGKWYLMRTDQRAQVDVFIEAYPQFGGVEFSRGSLVPAPSSGE